MSKFVAKSDYPGSSLPVNLKGFDLSNLTIDNLELQITKTINSKEPFFIISKRRQNERIKLDNEKQSFILEKIQTIKETLTNINQLKASLFLSDEFVANLIADEQMRAEHYFQLAIANHKKSLTKIISEIKLTENEINHDNALLGQEIKINEGIDADNEIKIAQAEKLRAEADSIKTQTELKRMVMDNIDFSNFPPAYISELVTALSGVNVRSFSEFNMEEKLNDIYERMGETSARKAEAEVNDFVNSAEYRKWKNDQAKKDFNNNGL